MKILSSNSHTTACCYHHWKYTLDAKQIEKIIPIYSKIMTELGTPPTQRLECCQIVITTCIYTRTCSFCGKQEQFQIRTGKMQRTKS